MRYLGLKIKKIITFIMLIILVATVTIICRYMIDKNSHLNVKTMNISLYIDSSDEASKDKLQVNWKELAAIHAVEYKNNLSNITKSDIKDLASMFLVKNTSSKRVGNSDYKLISLDEVLNKLEFEKKEKNKVYKYMNDLEYLGLTNNIDKNSLNKKFIDNLTPAAIDLYNKYNILPSVTIGQAILESGWGKSTLSTKANNLFGIKADKSWNGKKVNMKTSENYNDTITDSFRVYDNIADSLEDFGKFLHENQRYRKKGIFEAKHYTMQVQAIEDAGYSTKSDKDGNKIYADLVIKIIKENNLQLIDNKIQLNNSLK